MDAVIFDMDGTLLDTEPLMDVFLIKSCRSLGFELTESILEQFRGCTSHAFWAYLVREFNLTQPVEEYVFKEKYAFSEELKNNPTLALIEGVEALIQDLLKFEVPLAIASSASRICINTIVERFSLGTKFRVKISIASFHLAADSFHSQHHRNHLNEDYLVKIPLRFIEANWSEEQKAKLPELAMVDELLQHFVQLKKESNNYGIIHGDMHTGNFHFTDDNQITLFDFDYCAYGWRAYDLVLAEELNEELRKSLLDGYQSVRGLSANELESISLLNHLREIWDWGDELAIDLVR